MAASRQLQRRHGRRTPGEGTGSPDCGGVPRTGDRQSEAGDVVTAALGRAAMPRAIARRHGGLAATTAAAWPPHSRWEERFRRIAAEFLAREIASLELVTLERRAEGLGAVFGA